MPGETPLQRGPFSATNSLPNYNALIDAIQQLQQTVYGGMHDSKGREERRRPASLDIFLGYTTTTPANASVGSTTKYTDARYYVVRCVAPDPSGSGPSYDAQGSLTDNLSIDDDPFNGKVGLPQYVTATNLAELPGAVIDTSGISGTHFLPDNTIVLVIGFPSRQNPVQRTYVFFQEPPGSLFPVNLFQSGGSNGSASSTASYTYSATDPITGKSISGGPFSVTWARANGLVNVATHGVGYYDSSGDFVLYQADETPQETACS